MTRNFNLVNNQKEVEFEVPCYAVGVQRKECTKIICLFPHTEQGLFMAKNVARYADSFDIEWFEIE